MWTLTQDPLEKRLSPLSSLHKPTANIQTLSLRPSATCSWSPEDQQAPCTLSCILPWVRALGATLSTLPSNSLKPKVIPET